MKKAVCVFLSAAIVLTTSGGAQAEDNGFYAGFGLGGLNLDFSNAGFRNSAGEAVPTAALQLDFDHSSLIGLSGGYNWGAWSVELQYLRNLGDPDVKAGSPYAKGTYDYHDYRLSGVYRSQGKLYFLGRAGLSIPDIDTQLSNTRFRMGDTVFLGIGGGIRFTGDTSLELDWSRTQDDTDMLNVSLRHHF